jgi:hypothetical protein
MLPPSCTNPRFCGKFGAWTTVGTLQMRVALLASIAVVLVAVGAGVGIWWAFPPQNYEQCMLDAMKGQGPSMYSTVKKLCDRRFQKEQLIYSTDVKYKWDGAFNGKAHFTITDTGEYTLTRMKATFSSKECSEATNASDFNLEAEGPIVGNEASVLVDFGTKLSCVRGLLFYGTYK